MEGVVTRPIIISGKIYNNAGEVGLSTTSWSFSAASNKNNLIIKNTVTHPWGVGIKLNTRYALSILIQSNPVYFRINLEIPQQYHRALPVAAH
ncbi:hypothetical protein GCM10027170_19990 [Aliiglaciecola aliphaticivorans]